MSRRSQGRATPNETQDTKYLNSFLNTSKLPANEFPYKRSRAQSTNSNKRSTTQKMNIKELRLQAALENNSRSVNHSHNNSMPAQSRMGRNRMRYSVNDPNSATVKVRGESLQDNRKNKGATNWGINISQLYNQYAMAKKGTNRGDRTYITRFGL